MELVIVVVIVGTIAAFAIPTYNKSMQKTHEQAVVAQLLAMHSANVIYRARNGGYWNAGGSDKNLTEINNTLDINIVPIPGVEYWYNTNADATQFTFWTSWDSGTYEVKITEAPIENTAGSTNPCCWTMNCLSIPW